MFPPSLEYSTISIPIGKGQNPSNFFSRYSLNRQFFSDKLILSTNERNKGDFINGKHVTYNKTQRMKKIILIMLCILLVGIIVGIMVILSSRSEILPIQNLEHDLVNISEMEDISDHV